MSTGQKYYFKDEWRTLGEIARMCGMHRQTLHQRIGRGVPLEIATRLPKGRPGMKPRLFAGKRLTLKQIASKTGITSRTLASRLHSGLTIDQATDPERAGAYARARKLTFDGKTLTLREWAEEAGINLGTLRERLYQFRWSIERTLTEPPMNRAERHRRQRNTEIIRRTVSAFHQTGGYSQTSTEPTGTGAGRHETQLEGASA